MESCPWCAGLHELFQHVFFHWTALSHDLLQPWDTVPQEQTVLACEVTSPAIFKCAPVQAQNLLQTSTFSNMGSSVGHRWISALLCTTTGCKGTATLPWSSTQSAGEPLVQQLEHLLPLLNCPWCLQGSFFSLLRYLAANTPVQ